MDVGEVLEGGKIGRKNILSIIWMRTSRKLGFIHLFPFLRMGQSRPLGSGGKVIAGV